MIVVDASAVVELLLATPRAPAIREALALERRVHAPELLDPEVLQALRRWTYRKWVQPGRADQAIADLGDLPLVRHRHGALRARAWSLRERCSAYDAIYLALAEALDAQLLTADQRLAKAAVGLVSAI